jgi:DDE superfamily endonuclease.
MMTVFTEFLRVLVASMGVQGGNIFLFVDSCAAHLLGISFVRNVKVVYYPPNCISMLTSQFGYHMMLPAVLQEVPSTKSCVLHALGKRYMSQ